MIEWYAALPIRLELVVLQSIAESKKVIDSTIDSISSARISGKLFFINHCSSYKLAQSSSQDVVLLSLARTLGTLLW